MAQHGLAVRNLGAISEQAIGGLISTGTHGSGERFGIIATDVRPCASPPPAHIVSSRAHLRHFPTRRLAQVVELRLILANGQAVTCSLTEEPDLFQAARCGLGALGVISTVTLRLEPAFRLRERRLTQSLERTLADLPELRASSEHFKFLWYPHTDDAVLFALDRTTQPIERPSASYVQDQIVNHHLLESLLYVASFRPALVPAINRLYYNTQLRGQKSIRVDNSVDVFNFDCLFKQYVSEWAIPRYVAEHAGTVNGGRW